MKRVTWFVAGAAAGATGASYATKKIKETAANLAPANVAKSAASRAKQGGKRIVDAAREGRSAMREREDELKARRDARVEPIDDHLDPGDQLLVDGQPVEAGRVIVLKQKTTRRS